MSGALPRGGGVNPTKTVLRAASRYQARLRAGERVLRDAAGRMQWADGRSVGRRTIEYMLTAGLIHQLDADLFGCPDHGQTLGVDPQPAGQTRAA